MGTKHILVNNVPFDTDHMVIHLEEQVNEDNTMSYGFLICDRSYPDKRVYSLLYTTRDKRDLELSNFISTMQQDSLTHDEGPRIYILYKFFI